MLVASGSFDGSRSRHRERLPLRGRWRSAIAFILLFAGVLTSSTAAVAATLDQIRESRSLRIAYREDAPPFSYRGEEGQPAGFMVDLCRLVVRQLAQQLAMADLRIVYLPVSAVERFDAIRQARADLLCEATTATLARREWVDFSLPTFVDGASLMVRVGEPDNLKSMAGRKIGVVRGTTTEALLRNALRHAGISAELVLVETHRDAIGQLDDHTLAAYLADRGILKHLLREIKAQGKLRIGERYFSLEPYALAMRLGDDAFRLAVDSALSRIYRSGELSPLFVSAIGPGVAHDPLLQSLYLIAALPD